MLGLGVSSFSTSAFHLPFILDRGVGVRIWDLLLDDETCCRDHFGMGAAMNRGHGCGLCTMLSTQYQGLKEGISAQQSPVH